MNDSHVPPVAAPGELERLLRSGFESHGLTCELKRYGTGEERPVEELLVRNARAPERGAVRIYPDGSVVWEIYGTISAEGVRPILDEVISLLQGQPGQGDSTGKVHG
jgi:hypothetical protein